MIVSKYAQRSSGSASYVLDLVIPKCPLAEHFRRTGTFSRYSTAENTKNATLVVVT